MNQTASKSLGEFLRQEREKRGVTIEQVASSTKIGVKTLHSLEEDNYKELPAEPFVRGFVASYIRFIGLDPKEVLTQYNEFISQKTKDRPGRHHGTVGYVFEKRDGEQTRLGLWIIMTVLVLAGGVVMFFFKPAIKNRREHQIGKMRAAHMTSPSPSPSISSSGVIVAATKESVAPSPVPEPSLESMPFVLPKTPTPLLPPELQTKQPAPDADGKENVKAESSKEVEKLDTLNSGVNLTAEHIKHRVVIRAVKDQWVRYKIDGRPLTRIILRAGRILVLRAETVARIQVSNPDGAMLEYNRTPGKLFKDLDGVQEIKTIKTIIIPRQPTEIESKFFDSEPPLSKEIPVPVVRPDQAP